MFIKVCYLNEDLIENVDKYMFTKQLKENLSKRLNLNPEDVELKIDQILLLDEKYVRKVLETNFILMYNNESFPIKLNDLTFLMKVTKSAGQSVEIKDLTGEITIGELKQKLSVQLKFDKKDINLKCENENIMKDEMFLKDYIDIKTLEIVVKNKTKIKLNITYGDIIFSLNAFKEMTGEELRKEINKKFKIDIENFILEFKGKRIKLENTLNSHKIFDYNGIVIRNKTKATLNITYGDRHYFIDGFKEMTVEELQKAISEKVTVPIEDLELNHKTIKLEDSFNFDEINNDDVIVVKNKTKVTLNITYGDRHYFINGFKEMTVEELRKKINENIQMKIENYTLKINGKKIEPGDYLNIQEISDDNKIVVKNKTRVRVIIKHGGRNFSINAFKEMTGEELQKKINKIFETNNEKFNLDYNAKIIESSDMLSDHEICEDCVIMAVPKVDGGE